MSASRNLRRGVDLPLVNVTPGQVRRIEAARTVVRGFHEQHRPQTTKDTYEPKIAEFREFCDYQFPLLTAPLPRYAVDHNKVYTFLFYCAHRKKKKNGQHNRRRMTELEDDDGGGYQRFDPEQYDHINRVAETNAALLNPPPYETIGDKHFKGYKSALANLHAEQVAMGCNDKNWDVQVVTADVRSLMRMVQARKPILDRANHVEKIDQVISPYQHLDAIPRIEQKFWEANHPSRPMTTFAGLRDRFRYIPRALTAERYYGFALPTTRPISWNDMWDEWHGYGEYENKPCHGGFCALESVQGTAWRNKHHVGVKGAVRHFSRFKSIILAAKDLVKSSGSADTMMETFSQHFDVVARGKPISLQKFIERLQSAGIMPKRARNDNKNARERALDDLLNL